MTLTEAGKEYIAKAFGIGDCFVASGLTWTAVATDGKTADEEGGTASIVGRLVQTAVYKEIHLKTPRTGTYTYNALKNANDYTPVDMSDASWIADNDGSPAGEPQWCISAVAPTPTPTPTPTYKITLDSTPTGANITIDGKKTYRMTPETLDLDAGSHDIVLTKDGYEDEKHTITVDRDRTYSWTLTALPTPTPTPIEIEVVKGKLRGSVSIGYSRIPRRIATTVETEFRLHVDNPEIGVPAKYKVTLTFSGVHTYAFTSDWSEVTKPGDYVSVYVMVTMPDAAIPAGKEVAFYDLFCTLEAEVG